MLRIAVIFKLSRLTDKIVEIQKEKEEGKLKGYEIVDLISNNGIEEAKENLKSLGDIGEFYRDELVKVLKDNSIELPNLKSNEEKLLLKEGDVELSISFLIKELRNIETINWRNFFESTSVVEKALNEDPCGIYKNMDFKTKDHYRHKIEELSREFQVEEITLVEKCIYLALRACEEGKRAYGCHVGYYLIDNGISELSRELTGEIKRKNKFSEGRFVFGNIILTLILALVGIGMCYLISGLPSLGQGIISFLLLLIPCSEIVVTLFNFAASKKGKIRYVPKMDYSKGIPNNKKTIVVIPAILPNKERTIELMKQLERAYLGNRDSNIYFALLGDFKDSKEVKGNGEEEIIQGGLGEARRLNKTYFKDDNHFFFLVREKKYNPAEGVYMGYERKRGKLMEFMCLLRGQENHTFNVISSYMGNINDIKYLITLDADTFMPPESGKKLVGAMGHILNKATLKRGKVVHGYGVMQPKISISLESKNSSDFSEIFGGEAGVDGYSIAYSDTYEDLFGEGTFTGKGIIEIDTFLEVLEGEIPENTVLSHDLLEGAYARCALVTDVEFIDNYPSSYEASCKRLHRWVRGDWQIVSWIFSNKLSTLSKWKIFDNLRRSLLAPSLILAVFLNLLYFSKGYEIGLIAIFALLTPLIYTVTDFVVTPKNLSGGTFKNIKQIILIISFVPYQGYLMVNAILKSCYRMTISKKHRLQWVTAEEGERLSKNSLPSYFTSMWISILSGVMVIILSFNKGIFISALYLTLGVLWIASPLLAFYISQSKEKEVIPLDKNEKEYLKDNARRIWAYYEDFVNEENNYLAPDNFQEVPFKGVAHRTSPTNIGMGLISNLVAYDLGYLSLGGVLDRLEKILKGMDKLEKYNGHYFNWYDTKTTKVLYPRYVSTVDSGNLLGYLLIIKEFLINSKKAPYIREVEILGLKDALSIIEKESLIDLKEINEYEKTLKEILSSLNIENKGYEERVIKEIEGKLEFYNTYVKNLQSKSTSSIEDGYYDYNEGEELLNRIDKIIEYINCIVEEMDFSFLYSKKRGLFSIGYNLEENSLGNSYYDLLASESRVTSYLAIARGQVPQKHWFKLSRAMTNAYNGKSLVSWSGTMFEYFMPALVMKSYENTILDETYKSVLKAQKEFVKGKIPWGISESAYYYFDAADVYQYKAFGVPGIGMKSGLENELVISPYSTLMSLPYSREEGINNLKHLEEKGAYGEYGFIESIDYTEEIESPSEGNNVRCYMVHHLGMSLLALDNILNNNIIIERFHSIPEVCAFELLLKEKIPNKITFEKEENNGVRKESLGRQEFIPRLFEGVNRENPEVLLLSNGSYSTMLTLTGSGYGKKDNMTVYRWKGDNTSDTSGMFFYIKNLNSNDYWSATYEPCKNSGEDYKVEFTLDKGTYKRKDGSIKSKMEVTVSPKDNLEIRKITLKNIGEKGRSLEITSYMEVTLQSFQGDMVHPSFSNLFIGTQYNEENNLLLGNRRARVKDGEEPYIFHGVFMEGEMEGALTYETSRINFIGRNRSLTNPRAMDNDVSLMNTVGTVLDPIMSLRVPLRLEAGETKVIYFITGTSSSKEEAISLAKEYEDKSKIENTFIAYNKEVQLELKSLGIRSAQGNIYQSLSSYILFLHSGRLDREEYIKKINMHQQDLWPYGISGDLPIALAVVNGEEDMDVVRAMIKMHYYWKTKGLKTDLIIYNDEEGSYEMPLQNSILNAMKLSKDNSNIYIHNKSTMSEEGKNFLIGIANLYVDSDKGSILTQIKEVERVNENSILRHKELMEDGKIKVEAIYENENSYGEKLEISNEEEIQIIKENKEEEVKLDFFNGYGGFDSNDGSYVIKLKENNNTPAPWINVISNEDFGFHVSEVGSSYTWAGNSRENKITPWSNDWVCDPLGEALYIRDNKTGAAFSVTPKPIRDDGEYVIKHSFGYSSFSHSAHNFNSNLVMFAPKKKNLKVQILTLENLESTSREVSIYYYAQLVLGVYNYESSKFITTTINNDYIYGQNPYSKDFGRGKAFLTISGGNELSFTGDRGEFLGVNKDLSSPKALQYKKLSNRAGSIYDPCLCCETKLNIPPNNKVEIIILFGEEENEEEIETLISKYKNVEECEKALVEVKEYWSNFLGNIQVETEDKSLDLMLNGWLLYQTYSCRYLSRTAFYQSGGAYGFRDQLQDSMNLGIVAPNLSKEQIIRNASRQYLEGDVQHWWHPVVNSGIRTRFSDDLLWMPYAVVQYIKRTGDYSILLEKAPYLEDEPLKEGEDERYTIVNQSLSDGSIYEHCLKALYRGLNYGEHNIPLMGSGDWNDGMSTVGNKGKGESVWLGWFLYDILDGFIDLCKYFNDSENGERFKNEREFIIENLEKYAWDGGWYRRAYFDDGTPLGSRENPECQIDSLAQSWAVISKGGKSSRIIEAMEAVDRNLVKEDKGLIMLLAPPFNNSHLEPGYIKGYVPGVRENGGQYTHAAVWVILALTKLGFGDKAYKYYNMINPINHTKTELECRTYKTEPYVLAADVYIKEPHGGRGGWSWYTGASGWMYKVGIEDILGLKHVGGKGYKVEPCLPEHFKDYKIKIKNEKEDYTIRVKQGKENKIVINGEVVDIIPKNKGKLEIDVERRGNRE